MRLNSRLPMAEKRREESFLWESSVQPFFVLGHCAGIILVEKSTASRRCKLVIAQAQW